MIYIGTAACNESNLQVAFILNLQVAFIHCGTNNLDRDNPAEIRDGIASIVYTIQEKKPNATLTPEQVFDILDCL